MRRGPVAAGAFLAFAIAAAAEAAAQSALAPSVEPSLWGQAFASVYAPRADVFALAGRFRERGLKTALLSNTETAAMQFFANQGYDMFDATIFSCAEGTFKPEREIYEIAAGKLGVEPSRCAFIDDNPAYADGATSVGMHGIVYESLEQIENALRDLGAPC